MNQNDVHFLAPGMPFVVSFLVFKIHGEWYRYLCRLLCGPMGRRRMQKAGQAFWIFLMCEKFINGVAEAAHWAAQVHWTCMTNCFSHNIFASAQWNWYTMQLRNHERETVKCQTIQPVKSEVRKYLSCLLICSCCGSMSRRPKSKRSKNNHKQAFPTAAFPNLTIVRISCTYHLDRQGCTFQWLER